MKMSFKALFKKAPLLLCLVLAAALLAGCSFASSGGSVTHPRNAKIHVTSDEKIIEDYIIFHQLDTSLAQDISISRFGTYDGAEVMFIDGVYGEYMSECTQYVAGYFFVYPTSRVLEVYHDGGFYSLPYAFSHGILSREAVRDVYLSLSAAAPAYYKNSPTEAEIKAAYIKHQAEVGSIVLDTSVTLRRYGTFGTAEVMTVSVTGGNAVSADFCETVGKYQFRYPADRALTVLSTAESAPGFYSLSHAYAEGILTEADLCKLFFSYRAVNRSLYDEKTDDSVIIEDYISFIGCSDTDMTAADVCMIDYGSYCGARVVYLNAPIGTYFGSTEPPLSEYTSVKPYVNQLKVHCEGMFFDLDTAFSMGLLDRSDLNKINELSWAYTSYASEQEMLGAYNVYHRKNRTVSAEDTTLRKVWTDQGSTGLIVFTQQDYLGTAVPMFPYYELLVYSEGKIYTPTDALAEGIITEDQLYLLNSTASEL